VEPRPADEVLALARSGGITHALVLNALMLFEPHWHEIRAGAAVTYRRLTFAGADHFLPSFNVISTAPLFANAPETLGSTAAGCPARAARRQEVRRIVRAEPARTVSVFRCTTHRCSGRVLSGIPALSKQEIVERGHQAFFADYAEIERGLDARSVSSTSTRAVPRSRR
jgi:hypothetical protein